MVSLSPKEFEEYADKTLLFNLELFEQQRADYLPAECDINCSHLVWHLPQKWYLDQMLARKGRYGPWFWLQLGACCSYVTNFDFLSYTQAKFGSIRYLTRTIDEVEHLTFDANIVIAAKTPEEYLFYQFSWLELAKFEALTALVLYGCFLTDKDILQFTALTFPHLINVTFKNNQISCEGASALVDMFLHNTVLRVLELSQNNIGTKGFEAMIKLIEANVTITHLSLCYNPCKPNQELVARFENALNDNVKLDQFCAYGTIAFNGSIRMQKRQRLLALMVCANRMNLFLSDDLWLRSMQNAMWLLS